VYTSPMQKSSPMRAWWDWSSIIILFFLLETVASRLVATNWTSFLFLGHIVTYIGYVIGTALGYTRFSPRRAQLISFLYMLVLLPLQWTLIIEQSLPLEEQLGSVFRRLYFSFIDFIVRSPVEDPFLFIAFITITFWIISAYAGFQLVRNQNYLLAVIPSAIGLLIIQNYDNFIEGRIWSLAFFTLLALLLLGRLNYLENKKSWRQRHVFLSPDNSIDLTSTMVVMAGLIILFSWTPPASSGGFTSAIQIWNKVTKPWRDFTTRLENAVTALESPSGGTRGEFFGSELALGRGFPLSDSVMFQVQVPDLPASQTPPRYYWRGRVYDYYEAEQWYTTRTTLEDYSPSDTIALPPSTEASDPALFLFKTGELSFSLIYTPVQPIWFSREGSTRNTTMGDHQEVISWYAYPSILSGEAYQVSAILNNPNTQNLRDAGIDYPEWVTDKYLQLPEDFSPKISELALAITAGYDNPYDKASLITRYLRTYIEYADTLPQAPLNKDPLEWMLFENRQAYCVYYSSAEILMLRSLGIPARLAVGFAQGVRVNDEYIVRQLDAHAWPEVYFPGIGWVEFEPTASQPQLNRPLPPREQQGTDNINPELIDFLELEKNTEIPQESLRNVESATPDQTGAVQIINPSRYLIPLFIIFAAIIVYFSRRYSVPERLPRILRTTYERSGVQTPNWIINWERWAGISPIQRSFESINFALHLLKHPVPTDATPIERANLLKGLLPKARGHTQNLLDEHQTSLYTSHTADAARARRAAFNVRKYALLEAIRIIFEGRPAINP